jgi:hypothetical protein
MSSQDCPVWVCIAEDAYDWPASDRALRVDLRRCNMWIREVKSAKSRYLSPREPRIEPINSRDEYWGEVRLYQAPGGTWFFYCAYIDDSTRAVNEHAWGASQDELVAIFLRHPEIEPPPGLAAALSEYDATDRSPDTGCNSKPTPADRPDLVAAAPSEKGTEAATNGRTPEAPAELPELVTLDQAAALVNRSARTLERYKKRGLPRPFVLGGGGKPHEYPWEEMKEWLQKTFNRPIPEAAIQQYRHPKNT